MINQFQKHGYNRPLIEQQIDKLTEDRTTFERKKLASYAYKPNLAEIFQLFTETKTLEALLVNVHLA